MGYSRETGHFLTPHVPGNTDESGLCCITNEKAVFMEMWTTVTDVCACVFSHPPHGTGSRSCSGLSHLQPDLQTHTSMKGHEMDKKRKKHFYRFDRRCCFSF